MVEGEKLVEQRLMTKEEVRAELKQYSIDHPEASKTWENLASGALFYDSMCWTTHWSLKTGGDKYGTNG